MQDNEISFGVAECFSAPTPIRAFIKPFHIRPIRQIYQLIWRDTLGLQILQEAKRDDSDLIHTSIYSMFELSS